MATLQFPDSPGPNAVYDAPNGVQYVWTGEYWAANDAEDKYDARYVKVTGDNMTGDLTLGGDKIDLDASSGAITANGNITVGGWDTTSDTTNGVRVYTAGLVDIQRNSTSTSSAFRIYKGTDNVFSITSLGGIQSKGGIKLGGVLPGSPNIELNASDGSITAAGNTFIGPGTETNTTTTGLVLKPTVSGGSMAIYGDGNAAVKALNVWDGSGGASVASISHDGSASFGSTDSSGRRVRIDNLNDNGAALFIYGSTDRSYGDMCTIQCGTNAGDTTTRYINFRRTDGEIVGYIGMNGPNAVTYSTNDSDYRLKENVVPLPDSIERLKSLRPIRFNFITSPDEIFDGFIAHECTDIPKAVIGEKDAVDEEGNIQPQSVDVTRMIPLLTDALQKAVARIEELEAKVAALES